MYDIIVYHMNNLSSAIPENSKAATTSNQLQQQSSNKATKKKNNAEYKLKKWLMEDYDSEVRPVQNYTDVLTVKFELAIQQIVEVVSQYPPFFLKLKSILLLLFFLNFTLTFWEWSTKISETFPFPNYQVGIKKAIKETKCLWKIRPPMISVKKCFKDIFLLFKHEFFWIMIPCVKYYFQNFLRVNAWIGYVWTNMTELFDWKLKEVCTSWL